MGSPEAGKKRILPVWMTQPPQQAETKPKRRKKGALARIETVYCMNEAELVDMALCILAENCRGKEVEVTSSEDEVQEPQQVPANHHPSPASDSHRSSLPTPGSKPPKLDALSCSEKTKSEEDDDDALKYVREIFFS